MDVRGLLKRAPWLTLVLGLATGSCTPAQRGPGPTTEAHPASGAAPATASSRPLADGVEVHPGGAGDVLDPPVPSGVLIRARGTEDACVSAAAPGQLGPGVALRLASCAESKSEHKYWLYDATTKEIHSRARPDLCWATTTEAANGSGVVTVTCANTLQNRKRWDYDFATGQIRLAASSDAAPACVHMQSAGFASGTLLEMWNCAARPPPSKSWNIGGGPLSRRDVMISPRAVTGAACIHKDNGWSANTKVHLKGCACGHDDRAWDHDVFTGLIRNSLDETYCLVAKTGFSNGALLGIALCDSTPDARKTWVYDDDTGLIRAVHSEAVAGAPYCIHKQASGFEDGNPVHLWRCDQGTPEFKSWNFYRERADQPLPAAYKLADGSARFRLLLKVYNQSGRLTSDPEFQGWLAETRSNTNAIFAACGVQADFHVIENNGAVVLVEKPEWTYTLDGVERPFVFETSGDARHGFINLFAVQEIEGAIGRTNASRSKSALWATVQWSSSCPKVEPGGNVAHEIGHLAGLPHPYDENANWPSPFTPRDNFMAAGGVEGIVLPNRHIATAPVEGIIDQCHELRKFAIDLKAQE